MAASRTYKLVDPVGLAAKIVAAGGPKIDPTQPIGTAFDCGVKLGWLIEGTQITITILSKPFLIPSSTIWDHVDELFAEA